MDPVAIVQQLKTLTDIEGDLADAALAVQASSNGADAAQGESEALASASDAADQDPLRTAEALESVLEGTMPPAPPRDTSSMETAQPSVSVIVSNPDADKINDVEHSAAQSLPQVEQPDADAAHAIDMQSSAVAHEAQEAIQKVVKNEAIPILPATDVDAPVEATSSVQPAATGGVVAESEMKSIPVDSVAPPAAQHGPDQSKSEPSQEEQWGALDSVISADQQFAQDAALLPSQTPFQSLEDPKIQADLPANLSIQSSSIVENPDLISAWRHDPKNSRTLLELFTFSVQRSEIIDARAWYTALSKVEASAVQPLLLMINLELSLSNFSEVESLFARALKGTNGEMTAAADVSIWKAYLHYIRRQNPITEGAADVEQIRTTISKAYEFALQQCGTDRESGEIWQEYISFVSEPNPKNTWETQQQMDSLRKIYQRAVCIPLNNVEILWKAYDAFESGLNKLTAKKFLAERSPAYMTARTALRELRALTEGLPHPALPPHPTFSDQDRSTVNAWKSYLRWEESNPLVIEDQAVLNHRIKYAFRQCLGDMRHFPELWHYAANWHITAGKKDEAAEVLQAGVEACPCSYLLTFTLADLEEDRGNFATCHEVYEALINRLNPEIDELKELVAAEVDRARGPEISKPTDDDAINGDDGLAEVTRLIDEREARGKHVAEQRGKDVADLATAASVVWIMYMRFAQRAEGLKAARGVFGKARKSPHVTWHTFEASAMLEYHSNKDSAVAIRIFELGFKLFSEDVDYVVRYLQFLLSINDDSNARALFERSASKIPAAKARPLWDTWARYEYLYGDLAGVHKLESRFAEVFPNDSPLKRFAQRFVYNGIDQVALRDLGFGKRLQGAPPPAPSTGGPIPGMPLTGSHHPPPAPVSLPPPAVNLDTAGVPSPPVKRPFPTSDPPRAQGRPRGSVDRSQSPSAKRYRPTASPPPPRRYPLPERERMPSTGRYDDRSSLPPQQGAPHARGGGSVPPYGGLPLPISHPGPLPPRGPPIPIANDHFDRSGLTKPLAWFIDSLPSARSFNGPVFRADDIMSLFNNISGDGLGVGAPTVPPVRTQGYPPRM
ncbi:hypothetical protein BD324DRAFT_667355 [Kockovaella imperatae]|uniref:mRNA 3'-end-processing protein RNA14 n=1 Tax=Kockovaella imperatae TaxID=4999 RepID=A0A1Y1UQX0_9TREE|nr:hypothetical protein BD324DRAFT_667355 [Kockovaella imperatae]ORX39874.1 hypothetical protein BD324DRAFT_667355 [Kockovaella imperatae]